MAAILALSWMYNYVCGKHPPGADQLDHARTKIADKARDMKERAKEYGQYVQHKTQEATQGSTTENQTRTTQGSTTQNQTQRT